MNVVGNQRAETSGAPRSRRRLPDRLNALAFSRGARRCNLVLVARPGCRYLHDDLTRIARYVGELTADVRPIVLWDTRHAVLRPNLFVRPCVVVSPLRIRRMRWCPGKVYQGDWLKKSEEYTAMQRCGLPVPRWVRLTRGGAAELEQFGQYVVCKPDVGGRGAEVKIKRRGRVRWKPPGNRLSQQYGDQGLIIQRFVYTGPWPVSFRVTTWFGHALFSWKVEADRSRRPLRGANEFDKGGLRGGGMSIVSSGKGCTFELNDDPEVIALGERAHAAFPHVPLLGVDIVREQPSGKLYILEVNASGAVWHFSNRTGRGIQRDANLRFESQFDGLRKAARVLVEQTRSTAA